MKKLLIIFFVCFGFLAKAQVFTPMTAAGYQNKRTKTDSTNYIPTFPGFPTLRSTVAQKQAAIAADSTNKLFYWYDPKTETWNVLGSGSGSTINIFNDTTILICSGTNNCDTFITNVTANYVSIFNDSTLIVCNTEGACDTININPTNFGVSVVSFTKNAAEDSIILTLSDNTRLAVKDSVGVGISTINIITDSSISICNFNSCDTFITNVTAQLVTILDDSTLLVCDTLNVCDTLHIPRTQFAQTLFDTTTIYQNIQNVYNYFSDTSFTNQFFPRGDGVLLDTVIRITDSTLRFIYTDGTQKEDTFRIALTQENITNITNIINYIDSLRGNDTTFILSASNLQSGLKALYSTTDSLSGNDTLHLEFPHNNIAEDSVLTTDVDGDLKMKLVTSGGGAIGNVGTGYRWITDNGTNAKTFFPGIGILIDSTTNANGLTINHDTTYGKKYFLYGLLVPNDSTVKLDSSIAVTFDHPRDPYTIFGNNTASYANPTFFTNQFADSLRRLPGSINVQRRVNGQWYTQYTDSVGSGGAGVSGTGLQYQVTYWDPTNTIKGSTTLTYNPAISAPTVTGGSAVAAFNVRPTVTATQNNDTLVNFYAKGTFVPGAFTGVTYFDYRADSDIVVNNVRIGRGTGGNGSNTVVGGAGALGKAQTGGIGGNVAIGQQALFTNTTGENNTSIGTQSMLLNRSGSRNTAIGTSAGGAITTATENVAMGYESLKTDSTGLANTSIGALTLRLNVSGSSNTAIGWSSLSKSTNAAENTGVGAGSLQNATTGGANTSLGYNSLFSVTTGTNNIGIGRSSGNGITTGSRNTIIGGTLTGWQFTTGNDNTMVGWEAGYRLATSASGNIFIGKLAGANGSLASLSNKFVLANDSAAANQLMFGDLSTGQLLINANTITPAVTASAQLEVNSTTRGFLLPRMTKTQRDAIASPVAGLAVYQTDNTPGLRVYNGTNWMRFTETAD